MLGGGRGGELAFVFHLFRSRKTINKREKSVMSEGPVVLPETSQKHRILVKLDNNHACFSSQQLLQDLWSARRPRWLKEIMTQVCVCVCVCVLQHTAECSLIDLKKRNARVKSWLYFEFRNHNLWRKWRCFKNFLITAQNYTQKWWFWTDVAKIEPPR